MPCPIYSYLFFSEPHVSRPGGAPLIKSISVPARLQSTAKLGGPASALYAQINLGAQTLDSENCRAAERCYQAVSVF